MYTAEGGGGGGGGGVTPRLDNLPHNYLTPENSLFRNRISAGRGRGEFEIIRGVNNTVTLS